MFSARLCFCWIVSNVNFSLNSLIFVTGTMSTNAKPLYVPVAYYEEIKDLPNHREKLLVDVREPSEIQKTGRIPTSINVPCKSLEPLVAAFAIKLIVPFTFSVGNVQKAFSDETTDEEFERSYNHTKPHKKNEIITSCQSGMRSQAAAEILIRLGYKE